MAYLNIAGILTDTQTHIIDNTTTMRAKLLNWLNDVIRGFLSEPRSWWFLRKTATVTVTSGVVTLPADFGELVSIACGSFIFTPVNNLTYEEQFEGGSGYILTATTLTLYPTPSETSATLVYTVSTATDFTDVATETFLPRECAPYLKRQLLAVYYEYDNDERLSMAYQLAATELRKLKAIDNLRKPVPDYAEFQ
jgi:hypothetical protein